MVVSLLVEVAHAGRAVRGAAEGAECGAAQPVSACSAAGTPACLRGVRAGEGAEQPVGGAGRDSVELGPEPGQASAGGGELRVSGAAGRVGNGELDHRADRPGWLGAFEGDLFQGAFGDPGVNGLLVSLPGGGVPGGGDAEVGKDVAYGPEDDVGQVGGCLDLGEGDGVD